jgi:amino acid adenylation domain-containing protein
LNQRDELFAYLLEREGFERQSDYTIPRRDNGDDPPPLSFAQERFWFLDQFEHARPVYNGCKVERLVGDLNVAVLVKSLDLIMHRHEVLRTTYPAPDGRPIQRIATNGSVELGLTDLEHVADAELPRAIEQLIRNEWLQPIDLSEALPIRVRLARIGHAQHLLILTLHQIVFDSQSVAIFFGELWSAYESIRNSKEPQLAALPVQYADFANWQRQRVSGETFQSHRAYWVQRLSGVLPVLNLPTDKPRPPAQGFDGSRLPLLLPETLQLKLKALSRANGVSLFVTLLAVFKTLLYRYTAQEDLIVGCPVLNRQLPEVEDLLGSFVNTVVLRTNYSGSPTFRETLYRVRETCVGAFAHQDFPFEKLVEELQPPRDVARNPIFQVMFAFQNTPVPALELPGLRSESVEIDGGMTKFDLTLSLVDKKRGIAGHIEYSTDLFRSDTIERMARHFQVLLEAIAADPDQSIATLPLMTELERHQVLFQWNDTAGDSPRSRCIHELFEARADRTPDAIAVEFEGQRLTYTELNARANQIGHHLISLGAGPEALVGICVERSIEMVVGLLGILKVGAAYIPLDPAFPPERLNFMLEDSRASIVLTQQKHLKSDSWSVVNPRITYVCIDEDWPIIQPESTDNPQSESNPDNLAYVIYTSGSSGQPKGVQVSHRSVVNCLLAIGERVGLTNQDRLFAVTTISFDIAALELYLPLLVGGTVVVGSREEAMDGNELARRVKESSATVMQGTPSTWRMLVDAGWEGSPRFKILCGGESLSRELAAVLLRRGEVWNLYGPTETTVWSTIHKVESGEGPVSVGRPLTNTQIYILDSNLRPVPFGVHGELYIGGEGLARGYLNQPELTAEKFLPNPYGSEPDTRLYRTGDIARYLADGSIEFIGRVDNQVKIRGYRIELAEIEAAMSEHPGVSGCAVVARDEPKDETRKPECDHLIPGKELVAYVVSRKDQPMVSELRHFLKAKIPEFMLPSFFVRLEQLPLTPNGKVDWQALPSPDATRPRLDQGFVEPRTEIEELVAQVWKETLKLDKIGVYDNFFELGGHSLLATRVVARLRANLSIDLPLRKLFESPTIAELTKHIDFCRKNRSGLATLPLSTVPRDHPLPLSFSQQRLWFLHKVESGLTAYNIPATFHINGPLNIPALEKALNEMLHRHEILRTRINEIEGRPVQEIVSPLTLSVQCVDLSDLSENRAAEEIQRISFEDARQPFNLQEAPLMRVKLLRVKDEEHVLIFNFHHIIFDGSSLKIFYAELATVYEALLQGRAAPLPSLPVQYGDYAVWQQEALQAGFLESQLLYWKRQLGTELVTSILPTDYPRPAAQTYAGAKLTQRFSDQLTNDLKQLSRREGVTLFMTLMAAFSLLLSRHTGREDIVIGSTIAGRNQPEVEGLIGFFINALALRIDLSGNPMFVVLLKRVREACLDAFTHQDLPFEKVVEKVNPERDLGRNPLFQVMFNMADTSERVLNLAGCDTAKLWHSTPEAKFDITLYAPEKDGRIELSIVYNTDLFSEVRIAVMLDQFVSLLSQVVSKPERSLDQYSLVTVASKVTLPDPAESLDESWYGAIHALFTEQAQRVLDRCAVIDANGCWTYKELDALSNQLANCLIANGVKSKDPIAIYARRSSSLVLALLGVLKAGAVFIILDPGYPPSRLIDYLRIARPKGWIELNADGVPSELSDCLNDLEISCRINLPATKEEIADFLSGYPGTDTGVSVNATDPAYVAFTSGSTGQPKGVLGRHGPITHFLPWQENAFELKETDRFCLLSGLAYNHLHRDVFTPLALGATLHVPAADLLNSPKRLTQWLRTRKITILHLTPALGQFVRTSPTALPSVRRIFFGGDTLTAEDAALAHKLAPNAKIFSFYGATETQRAVGCFEIPTETLTSGSATPKAIPLGRGIKDVQLLLLTNSGQQAGIGEMADLYVRSPHLAQGYIGDRELTAKTFSVNPFTNQLADRLYKTGELGRYSPEGNVEWIGRKDRRVSIRGFRVDLGEVEAVLRQCAGVKNAAVVAKEFLISGIAGTEFEELRIIAYIEARQEQLSSINELRCFLSARVPHYMVPPYFLLVDHLPLSPNGKVDYLNLPSPDKLVVASEAEFELPETPVEQTLAQMFSEVLGVERICRRDNFFHLGGHSLLAAQVAARVAQTLNVALDLRSFLEAPTVEGLGRQVEMLLRANDSTKPTQHGQREEFEI